MAGDPTIDTPPPFITLRAGGAPSPIVISVPHAGRFYPTGIDRDRAVSWSVLHDLEDRYADRLIQPAVADGAVAIVATHARAWIDLNRAAEDRETSPSSPHGKAGLGLVPQRLGGRNLWRRMASDEAIDARVAALHRPYHEAVSSALAAAHARHGIALLIDCHSMPPIVTRDPPRLVVGDRHGTTAADWIAENLVEAARSHGLTAARNRPYAGAYGLARHSDPKRNIHAIQLEFDRSLYLDGALREPSDGLTATSGLLAQLCRAALRPDRSESFPQAAE